MLRILIITEDEPFYLADAFRYLLERIPDEYTIVSAIVLDYFHMNRQISERIKALDILRVFGPRVMTRMLWQLLKSRIDTDKRVSSVLSHYGIPVMQHIQNINDDNTRLYVQNYHPDLIVSVGVNTLFKKSLREFSRLGCINVHTGIYPEHRGRAPIFWALADGYSETGITVHFVDGGIDSGHIITTSRYQIIERSLNTLLHDLRILGMDALLEALALVNQGIRAPAEHHKQLYKCNYRPLPNIKDLLSFIKRGNRIF